MTRLSRRGPWSPEEDRALTELVRTQGPNNWVRISQQLQQRSPKQCRERYHQNLKPSLNHDPITTQEGELIEQLVNDMGKRWAEIARRLGDRSDNAVKNWWNGSMNRRKRLPSQNHNLKHSNNRLQPMTPARTQRNTEESYTPQWSLPDFSSLDTRTLRPSISRHDSGMDFKLRLDDRRDHAHAAIDYTRSAVEYNDSCSQYAHNELASEARLAPLRLPPISNSPSHFYVGQGASKPSISPAISEFSQASRPVPSLVSDNQSTYSVSPKAMVSPRVSTTSVWHSSDRALFYDYTATHNQLPSMRPQHGAICIPAHPAREEACHYAYTTSRSVDNTRCGGYGSLLNPAVESSGDSRMHLSRLVQ